MKSLLNVVAVCGLVAATAVHAGAVVVGKDSAISPIDADTAKRIFLGRAPNMGGQDITVIYQGDSATRTDFESKVLGKTGADLSTYWSKLIFTGKATAPIEVVGDAGVKAKLVGNPGAIGYVSDGAVDSTVKIVFKY